MKKIVLCMLFLCLVPVLCACGTGGGGDELPPNTLQFSLSEDGQSYVVTGIGTYESTDIVIPDTYQSLPVTEVGYGAFMTSDKVSSVVFGNNVKVIGESAFWQCHNLEKVSFSDSIERIGNQAFADCPRIAFLAFGSGLTSIEETAFGGCHDLVSVTLNEALTAIGRDAFCDSYKLFEIVNNSSLDISFNNKESDQYGWIVGRGTVDIHSGESALRVENDYIFGTHGGKNYLLGYVGDSRDIVLPASYGGEGYEIYQYAFSYTDRFSRIDTGDGVTAIGNDAFSACETLLSLRVGASVRESDGEWGLEWGVWGLQKLVEIVNDSPLSITAGSDALGTVRNTAVIVHGGESVVKAEGNFLYAPLDGVYYILEYRGEGGKLVFPESIQGQPYGIYDFALAHRSDITEIDFGGARSIGASAFYGCDALTRLDIGDTVEEIGENAFESCPITAVSIGKNVKRIEGNPFAAVVLESISVSAENPVYHATGNCLIETETKILISGCIRSVIPEGEVTAIADRAFFGAHGEYSEGLVSVTVPEGVKRIGAMAFGVCSDMTEITLPSTLAYIGEYAFVSCHRLTAIRFAGTTAQWNAIEKAENWDNWVETVDVVCSDGIATHK